jgi:tripartite-type tricarboxylate transporter receptor subunit TctC
MLKPVAALLLAVAATAAQAQTYPSRPISMVVGVSAGGATDTTARVFADAVSRTIGQRVVVDNRPGASGVVAATTVQQAAPDGYTIMVMLGGLHTINPALETLPFDPVKGFQPITMLTSIPSVLVVPATSPANTVAELLELGRRKKGLFYGSPGAGSPLHLAAALFQKKSGVEMSHVAYKGAAPMTLDLVAGRLDFAFLTYGTAKPHVQEGRLRVLALGMPERWANLPTAPTMTELGYPGVDVDSWFALAAPAGTPDPVIRKLQAEFNAAAKDPDLVKRMTDLGFIVRTGTPEDVTQQIVSDLGRFGPAIKEMGIKAE